MSLKCCDKSYNCTNPYPPTTQNYMTIPTEAEMLSFPIMSTMSGSWGPIAWSIDINVDTLTFKVTISYMSMTLIDVNLTPTNPSANFSYGSFSGSVVLDTTKKQIYLKGKLGFFTFTIILLKY